MNNYILELGRPKSVALITLFSILFSIMGNLVVSYCMDLTIDLRASILSILMPLIIAPSVSWYIMGLYIKISLMEKKFELLSTYDTLTGVMTRMAFLAHSETLYRLMQRNGASFSLVYIDLDDFKKINDTYGHSGGDEVLKSFGTLMRENVRKSDLIGRLGGEEFSLALPNTDVKSAEGLLNKIRQHVADTIVQYGDQTIGYTISVGITSSSHQGEQSLDTLIKDADKALYRAKELGKNQVVAMVY